MKAVENSCGKGCGECGKLRLFHRKNGSFPKMGRAYVCINICIKTEALNGKLCYVTVKNTATI